MTRDHLAAWAQAGESETLEFKRTTGERREAAQTLCAMLKHHGGRVLFGVEADGTVRGQQVSDKTLEDVAQEIKEIDPPVFPSIERVAVDADREVLVVSTTPGQGRPYSFKGKAYRRVGNTNQVMSRDEYNRMLLERVHGEVRWENQVAAGWSLEDLDRTEITRTVDEAIRRGRLEDPGTREPVELLRGLGLLQGDAVLRAAAVLFGRQERVEAELPQCLLRVARFKGRDKSEFLDNRQFYGHAFRLLQMAERFLRDNLPIAGRIVPAVFERIDDPLYPPAALREALANAICHRDYTIGGGSVAVAVYDDRVEVTSSGSLHFGLTTEQLYRPHESLPWNPLIARAFYRRGIMEAWGRGTLKIRELTKQAGLPPPEIEEGGGCVTIRFSPKWATGPSRAGLSDEQQRILQVLAHGGPSSLREIVQRLGSDVSPRVVRLDLAFLKERGLVNSTGYGRGAYWQLAE